MRLDFGGRTCFVVGGTSGIGLEVARGFAAAGAEVAVGSSSRARLDEVGDEFGTGVVRIDVVDESSVRAAMAGVRKLHGRLDILVNAAGVSLQKPTLDMELQEWQRVLDVNLTGAFLVSREAGKIMAGQASTSSGERGRILHIVSMASFVALADVAAYGCSKAGLMHLTKSLANDWARLGIRVNAVAPGFFLTDINRARMEGTKRGDSVLERTPMGRFGAPSEVVGAALFLCSDAASFTTGEVIVVDGGFLARGIGTP